MIILTVGRYRLTFLLVALTALLGWCGSARSAAKPLLVHYMPWYVAKPYSTEWGWHWTMNHYNPETTNALGHRQIASWYYPQIGPYDSADPVVLEYHVLLMKLAGIDGVIIDWYGQDDFNDYATIDQRVRALLSFISQAGLKFCLCYEDRTVGEEIKRGHLPAADAVNHAQQTMLYAQNAYFNHRAYLRDGAGKPILLNFGPNYFTQGTQWTSIFSGLDETNRPAFFTLDQRLPIAAGAFNWPPMYLSDQTNGCLSVGALRNYLENFERNGRAWPQFISSSFPRFKDVYQQAGVRASYGSLEDDGLATLRSTLERAMTNSCAMIQLVTWNDFGEGTVLEPTIEHGSRELALIQELRRQYLDPAFPTRPAHLDVPLRLYQLRRKYKSDPTVAAELDRIFHAALSGNFTTAELQLSGIESGKRLAEDSRQQ